jgi:hypothetical protein
MTQITVENKSETKIETVTLDQTWGGQFYMIHKWDLNRDLVGKLAYCHMAGHITLFHPGYFVRFDYDNEVDMKVLLVQAKTVDIKFTV